jgi:GNAT superfamily N-acetyltransferase
MAETALKAGAPACDKDAALSGAELAWDTQAEALRRLFAAVWPRHRVTGKPYFDWQFLERPGGRPVAFCARQEGARPEALAGVYLVMPATLLAGAHALDFSVSVYTATHPDYQRRGIFSRLAGLTYERCEKQGVAGTVGVPNNNSLPGFMRLGFTVLGRMELLARPASPLAGLRAPGRPGGQVIEFKSPQDFSAIDCRLDRARALSGGVLFERGTEFLAWRYLRCPGVRYRMFGFLDKGDRLAGFIALRRAVRGGLPLTVIVDFLVDRTAPDAGAAAAALLARAHLLALKTLAPVVIALANPFSYEAAALQRNGFTRVGQRFLPHECNLILKAHADQPGPLAGRLMDFRNWHFSFGDYDIF